MYFTSHFLRRDQPGWKKLLCLQFLAVAVRGCVTQPTNFRSAAELAYLLSRNLWRHTEVLFFHGLVIITLSLQLERRIEISTRLKKKDRSWTIKNEITFYRRVCLSRTIFDLESSSWRLLWGLGLSIYCRTTWLKPRITKIFATDWDKGSISPSLKYAGEKLDAGQRKFASWVEIPFLKNFDVILSPENFSHEYENLLLGVGLSAVQFLNPPETSV